MSFERGLISSIKKPSYKKFLGGYMYYINKALFVTLFSIGALAFSGVSAEPTIGVQSGTEIVRGGHHGGHHGGGHHKGGHHGRHHGGHHGGHHNWDRGWNNWGGGYGYSSYQPYYYSYPSSSSYYYSDPYYYYDNYPYYNTGSGVSLRFGF